MKKHLNDLYSFKVVADEQSFTRAAAKLSISQSALSHAIKGLEERLQLRLLHRTTRSVSLTEAGKMLYESLAPSLSDIENLLESLQRYKLEPHGRISISAAEYAACNVLLPKIQAFLKAYPQIQVEINVNPSFVDIVAEGYDAGIRLGESLKQGMVALKISDAMRMAVVATPDYFEQHSVPLHPNDLQHHNCINIRLATYDQLMPWEFEKEGHELRVQVNGSLTANSMTLLYKAVLAGVGLGYVPEDNVLEDVAAGRLVRVLEDWCEPFDGHYLYYPHRSDYLPAFAKLIEFLKET